MWYIQGCYRHGRIEPTKTTYNSYIVGLEKYKRLSWWWFQGFFYVHPYLGKMSNLTFAYFSGGLVQPPTSYIVLLCPYSSDFVLLNKFCSWSISPAFFMGNHGILTFRPLVTANTWWCGTPRWLVKISRSLAQALSQHLKGFTSRRP